MKVREEMEMKITFQKWTPNIVKRGHPILWKKETIFRLKKKNMSLLLHGILKSLFASNLPGPGKS